MKKKLSGSPFLLFDGAGRESNPEGKRAKEASGGNRDFPEYPQVLRLLINSGPKSRAYRLQDSLKLLLLKNPKEYLGLGLIEVFGLCIGRFFFRQAEVRIGDYGFFQKCSELERKGLPHPLSIRPTTALRQRAMGVFSRLARGKLIQSRGKGRKWANSLPPSSWL